MVMMRSCTTMERLLELGLYSQKKKKEIVARRLNHRVVRKSEEHFINIFKKINKKFHNTGGMI